MVLLTEDAAAAARSLLEISQRFDITGNSHVITKGSRNNLAELISKFSITTKQGLVAYREKNAESYLGEAVLFAETSGTTGQPLQIPRTQADLKAGVRNYALAYMRYLKPRRDRLAFIHPSHLSPLRDLTVRTLQDHNIGVMTVFPIPGVFSYERIHGALENNKITTLMSSPSIIAQTLYNFHLRGLELPNSIERIFVTGEYFSNAQANNIRRLIGRNVEIVPIVYGANEIGMMMYGDESLTYRGFLNDYVFECLPLDDPSKFVEDLDYGSHLGELLVTGLTPSAMPIIRYNTKDVFVFKEEEDGSWHFKHVGRNENLPLDLRTRNLIDETMYSLPWPIFHYTIELRKDGKAMAVQILSVDDSSALTATVESSLAKIMPVSSINVLSAYNGPFRPDQCISKISRFVLAG